jgi:hypothetical protein
MWHGDFSTSPITTVRQWKPTTKYEKKVVVNHCFYFGFQNENPIKFTEIEGSYPTLGMNVCPRLSFCVVVCIWRPYDKLISRTKGPASIESDLETLHIWGDQASSRIIEPRRIS